MAETKALTVVKSKADIKMLMERHKDQIVENLPKHVNFNEMLNWAYFAAVNNPTLYECTAISWAEALLKASEFGLNISGTNAEAYLIPYGGKVQYQIGYAGFLELIRRAGGVKAAFARPVREKDEFAIDAVNNQPKHFLYVGKGDPGDVIGYYFYVEYMNGNRYVEWMTAEQVEDVRKCSKAQNSPAWRNFPTEMGRKSVVKRGRKYVEQSKELQRAIDYDNEQFGISKATHVEANGDRLAQVRARITEPQEAEPLPEPESEVIEAETEEPGPEPPKEEPKPQPKRSFITPEEKTELMTVIEERKIPEDEVQGIIRAKGATTIGRLPSGCYEEVWNELKTWRKE